MPPPGPNPLLVLPGASSGRQPWFRFEIKLILVQKVIIDVQMTVLDINFAQSTTYAQTTLTFCILTPGAFKF
jgi:hypothetical protein